VKSLFSLTGLALAFTLARAGAVAAAEPSGNETSTLDQLLQAELGTSGGLTADQAAARAQATSPAVRRRNEELLAAAAEVDRATWAYLPRTTLTARYTRLSDTGDNTLGNLVVAPGAGPGLIPPGSDLVNVPLNLGTPHNQYTFQASLLVPVSDYLLRIGPALRAAKLDAGAAEQTLSAQRRSSAADARLTYYGWVRARLNVIVTEQALVQARAHLADARAQLLAGAASKADVLRVESQLAQSELLVVSSKNLSALSEEQLRSALHDDTGAQYSIGEDVRQSLPVATLAPLGELWAQALAQRAELKALEKSKSARYAGVSVERAGYAPRLEAFADAEYSNPNSRVFPAQEEFKGSWAAGAQLVWTISDLPSTGARADAASARARAVEAQYAELVDQIRIQVMSAKQELEEARVAEQTSARGLAAAEESYRARRLLYQNGRATTVELLDAETDLTRARLDALGARIDARVASVRLAYALGQSR
jgi:outer membrane protein TolC